jgi:hypothetical protein
MSEYRFAQRILASTTDTHSIGDVLYNAGIHAQTEGNKYVIPKDWNVLEKALKAIEQAGGMTATAGKEVWVMLNGEKAQILEV